MKKSTIVVISIVVVAAIIVAALAVVFLLPQTQHLKMATTTSTQDSGLLSYILPVFENETNCKVQVIAVGSGQALKMGERGDVDILMVHSPASEQTFVKNGFGTNRTQFMYNWFMLVGPDDDPAGTRYAHNASDAFQRIMDNGTAGNITFVSRADDSGTHSKELSIWSKLGYNKTEVTAFNSSWYNQAGQGMGAVLDMCEEFDAYTLSDDATFYARVETGIIPSLNITYSGDSALKNQYSIILVNSTKWTHINATMARQFLDWITSDDGQDLIKSYERYGHQLFTPNAPGYTSSLSITAKGSSIEMIAIASNDLRAPKISSANICLRT